MLTKTLEFDADILDIIRAMEWREEGKLGILSCGQLDRKLYLRLNKALEALGGKWNRKKAGHVFPMDPRLRVEGLIENGTLTIERDGFFETPPEIVERMIELVRPIGRTLEPSAGLGAIADNLRVPRNQIFCIEKNEQRAEVLRGKGYNVHCGDFLEYNAPNKFDTIIMNPPFEEGQDIDHVRHAYSCLSPAGAMVSVMSEGPFFREDRKAIAFRHWLEGVGGESFKLPPRSFNNIHTRLVVIYKDEQGDQVSCQQFKLF